MFSGLMYIHLGHGHQQKIIKELQAVRAQAKTFSENKRDQFILDHLHRLYYFNFIS